MGKGQNRQKGREETKGVENFQGAFLGCSVGEVGALVEMQGLGRARVPQGVAAALGGSGATRGDLTFQNATLV